MLEISRNVEAAGFEPVEVESAKGTTITGSDGKTYLDCFSGISVVNAGHNHPKVIAAAKAQIAALESQQTGTQSQVAAARSQAEGARASADQAASAYRLRANPYTEPDVVLVPPRVTAFNEAPVKLPMRTSVGAILTVTASTASSEIGCVRARRPPR